MNIDFDSLRDPDAPIPGSRERAGVDARARRLRARARMNRLALSSVSVVAVVALVFGIVASQRNNGPEISVQGPISTAPSSIGDRFVPPTSVDNGIVTVPVTLPDGETTTLTYPQDLRIAQLGFTGGIGVSGTEVLIKYTTIREAYGDTTPLATYPGASGRPVPLFHGYPGDNVDYLAFQFGPWLVRAASTDMSAAQRGVWARSLTGTVDDNGYLVLHAAAPLSLNDQFDGGFGPFVAGANEVELSSHLHCGAPESDSSAHRRFANGDGTRGVSWCVGNDLHVSASGSQTFVAGADRGLQVSPLTPAITTPAVSTTTTTTTTLPVTLSSPAISASFVSPDQGWALEHNGSVAETTDGGATWTRIGTLGTSGEQIRFADATHGYELDPSGIMTTVDGGAHWTRMTEPFGGNPFDLAVAHNTVYVAAGNAQFGVNVWTTPIGSTNWTAHPTGVSIGAGPIPDSQLVFSGQRGWLVHVNRTVTGGAQLGSDGQWHPWTPPCANAGGAAFLAASSPSDLVASCEEGAYTGPRVTHGIYFSKDGGQTFTRHPAPESGLVATPNGTTAIVTGGAGVQRTTDGGVTWHGVFDAPLNAVDLGFTTPTQGFIVFSNGTMLMTHDAGATWQKVTLP